MAAVISSKEIVRKGVRVRLPLGLRIVEVCVSRTFKDSREAKQKHWCSVFTPSAFNREQRRRVRNLAAQDMRNGREPQPRYGTLYYW